MDLEVQNKHILSVESKVRKVFKEGEKKDSVLDKVNANIHAIFEKPAKVGFRGCSN